MFVSRKQIEELEQEVAKLRADLAVFKTQTKNKTILQICKFNRPVGVDWMSDLYADIELKDIVQRIADHLGLEIKYVPGSDPGFTLEKKESARKVK